jgi:phosphoglycerol transferase MdoB-like AlkP superfamily enzyme
MLCNDREKRSLSERTRTILNFLAGLPLIFVYLLLLTLALKLVFLAKNWSALQPAGYGPIVWALWKGLRFDTAILSYLLLPAIPLYFAAFLTQWRSLKWVLGGYLAIISFLNSLLWLADLQYFEETGKHFTSELLDYLGPSIWPDISSAFKLHPLLSALSLIACAGIGAISALGFKWLWKRCLSAGETRRAYYLLALPIFILLGCIGARGGLQSFILNVGDSLISPNPYLNALCLNPVYSSFRTSSSPKQSVRFYREESNIRTVRELLGGGGSAFLSSRYALLRESPGIAEGNRKNVVIFLLESWSGKDVGCLGSKAGVTPVFDDLARKGLLFTHFYATGIRTSEGVFSTLCSFPNQPHRPIMGWQTIYQNRWRSISQILAEAGYHNLFIHGRDLDFARIKEFLQFIRFHKIIDKRDFPPSAKPTRDSWSGYDDEDVMRRADEEFASIKSQPFFGIVYTMNTHVPFRIPKSFPLAFPGRSPSIKFLNALKYSDHALGLFFDLAKKRSYFRNTIFLFVADHARTRDQFHLSDQHHIPLLIYSPGYIPPSINPVVGSQTDLVPTILGLLQLKATHASWGRDLREVPRDKGFAVPVVGDEVRWLDSKYLLNDTLADRPPLLFDLIKDPNCNVDLWRHRRETGEFLRTKLRAYISLSQTLLRQNRVYP